jgi:hypothetical protein
MPAQLNHKGLLGFEAKLDLEDGICRTAEYDRKNLS